MRYNRPSRIDSHSRKNTVTSFPAKRICADFGCSTILSIYNSSDYCFVHEPPSRHSRNDILR